MKKLVAMMLTAIMLLGVASAIAEDVTLNLWTIAVESDSSYQTFIDAIAAFEAAHPGVKINHEPTQNEQYKIKIKAAMSAGTDLPDVFFTWGMGFLGEFVNAGRVLCLDEYYDAYKDELPENMTANASYDYEGGKLYGVPYTMSEVVLFANMEILASVGYDHIPTTIEEMNECCDKLLEAGITPFGVSGKELWCLSEYLEPLMIKSVGTERLIKMYNGEESWNNPDVIAAVAAFQNMVNKNYFDPNAAALGNDEVKTNFIAGKYAFYQNGSWNCGDIDKSENPAKFQAGLFPVLNPDNASLYELIGGPNNTLAVTATTAHKEEAVTAAFELGRAMSDADYKKGANLPCWTPDPEAQVSDLVASVADIAAKAEGMVLFGDNFLSADQANTYLDYIGLAYAGDITPEEFAQGMDDALYNK
ncbi:MAG: extracellular solute-binding protein [Clostridia bacterium]|nr:extracellular solute-binding protein [Clostridia bacterium]